MTTFFNDHRTFGSEPPKGHYPCTLFSVMDGRLKTLLTYEPKGDNAAIWAHNYLDGVHVGATQILSVPKELAQDIVSGKVRFTAVDPRSDREKLRCNHYGNLVWSDTGEPVRCR